MLVVEYCMDIGPTTTHKEPAVGHTEPQYQFSVASVARDDRVGRPLMILSRAGGTSDGGIEAKNKSYPSGLLHRRGPQTSGDVGDVFVGR